MLPVKSNPDPLGAFLKVPFVATGSWYACELLYLSVVNGALRLKPDVLAFGIGSVLIGIPVAFLATFVLALPAYWLCRRLGRVNRSTAAAGGIAVGVALSLIALALNDPALMEWFIGAPVGGISGYVWWYLAGRPGAVSRTEPATA